MRRIKTQWIWGLGMLFGVAALSGCFHDDLQTVDWDRSSDTKIVEATFCCGFVPYLYVLNYVPDAQIWGDGRIVWARFDEDGQRSLHQAQLDTNAVSELLAEVNGMGFFNWEDRYENVQVADASDQCITVTLSTLNKQVCEYVEGAPDAFHRLYEKLASGVGQTGNVYIPSRGFLIAHPLQGDAAGAVVDVDWTGTYGFSLSEAESGRWIEGSALQAVWEIVNQKPWANTVRDGDNVYQLSLQIPDLVDVNENF